MTADLEERIYQVQDIQRWDNIPLRQLYLWLVERIAGHDYDTFDSFVCTAYDEQEAKNLYPTGDDNDWVRYENRCTWPAKGSDLIVAKCIGVAIEGSNAAVVLASYGGG